MLHHADITRDDWPDVLRMGWCARWLRWLVAPSARLLAGRDAPPGPCLPIRCR